MSRVLKRVRARIERVSVAGFLCPNCGEKSFRDSSEAAIVCAMRHCGATMLPHTFTFSYSERAHVLVACDCGETVKCDRYANPCRCGVEYRSDGSPSPESSPELWHLDEDTSIDLDEDSTLQVGEVSSDEGTWVDDESRVEVGSRV